MDGLAQLVKNLDTIDRKVRTSAMRKIGRAVGKVHVGAMRRRAQANRITGALAKSFVSKQQVKERGMRLIVIAGPSRGTVRTRKGVIIRTRKQFAVFRGSGKNKVAVLNRKGQQLIRRPSRYAHLAGKGRKGRIVQDAANQTKSEVMNIMTNTLREALR
jgi:hypothetical protein